MGQSGEDLLWVMWIPAGRSIVVGTPAEMSSPGHSTPTRFGAARGRFHPRRSGANGDTAAHGDAGSGRSLRRGRRQITWWEAWTTTCCSAGQATTGRKSGSGNDDVSGESRDDFYGDGGRGRRPALGAMTVTTSCTPGPGETLSTAAGSSDDVCALRDDRAGNDRGYDWGFSQHGCDSCRGRDRAGSGVWLRGTVSISCSAWQTLRASCGCAWWFNEGFGYSIRCSGWSSRTARHGPSTPLRDMVTRGTDGSDLISSASGTPDLLRVGSGAMTPDRRGGRRRPAQRRHQQRHALRGRQQRHACAAVAPATTRWTAGWTATRICSARLDSAATPSATMTGGARAPRSGRVRAGGGAQRKSRYAGRRI